jgi:hypothetical protein
MSDPSTSCHRGWRPGLLELFGSIDLRTLDPSSGIPRQAHKWWLRCLRSETETPGWEGRASSFDAHELWCSLHGSKRE